MPCPTMPYAGAKDWPALAQRLAGRDAPGDNMDATVRAILDDVQGRGDEALAEYGRRFDCETLSPEALLVTAEELRAALNDIPAEDRAILTEAADNIRSFHEHQKENSWWTTRPDGTVLGQMVTPVDRVGLYVPGGQGGQTPLISSLLMNAIPAQVAGVADIQIVSPTPRRHPQPASAGHRRFARH